MKDHPLFIITGANGGIGSELCSKLILENKKVVAAVRNINDAELNPKLDRCILIENDFEDWQKTEDFFKEVSENHGEIEGVAHCVGSIVLKPAHLTKEDEFNACIHKNLGSAFAVLRAATKRMTRNEQGGSIVLLSSAVAKHGYPNHEAIAAAKAGILGLAKSAAATYAAKNIRVNTVLPGLVDTPLSSKIVQNEAALKASEKMHALGRIGKSSEVAAAIQWLFSNESSWVTGQEIAIDGGLSSVHSSIR